MVEDRPPARLPGRQRRRQWGFRALTLFLALGLCELFAYTGLYLLNRLVWRQSPREFGTAQIESGEILHPYFGVAYNPQTHPGMSHEGRQLRINALGLPGGELSPLEPRREGVFRVGLLGGSFAWQFGVMGAETLSAALGDRGVLRGREVEVVNLAAPTFKQPQQAMILNYVLALGGGFDLVVNLDGFNEVALAEETAESSVFYGYPRMWLFRTTESTDARVAPEVYRLRELRELRRRIVDEGKHSWRRYSAMATLWGHLRVARISSEMGKLEMQMHQHVLASGAGYERTGPFERNLSREQRLVRMADLWQRSSLLLRSVAEQQGGMYLHALQPNQYVPDTKQFGPEEQQQAVRELSKTCQSVRSGYPLLLHAAEGLKEAGVEFVDLTMVFAKTPERLYVDDCCHVNPRGYEIVARRLADEIASRMKNSGR